MSVRTRQRADRLQRIARVGDTLAVVAEGAAAERRRALATEQDRLGTVHRYLDDYGTLVTKHETAGQTVGGMRLYRSFAGWLTELSQKQQNEVAQAEFLLEAAIEDARERRRFADALEHASDRACREARQESESAEQKALDEVGQRVRSVHLGIQVATARPSSSTGKNTP
ncbi:MAG: flagellar export protein FliJ [Gammaproteobacteria bacterium]|jgi:flagellar export protein FliJ